MKRSLTILALLLLSPLVVVGGDNSGIPDRVAALEEITLQQQQDINDLKSQGAGGSSGWRLTSVVVGCGEPPCERQDIGKVSSFPSPNTIVVETLIEDRPVLLWINFPDQIWLPSRRVFADANCELNEHITLPGPWWYQEVLLAPGPEGQAAVYLNEPPAEPGPWFSKIEPGTGCVPMYWPDPEPPDWAGAPIPAVPANQLADDLYIPFPRGPEPWLLQRQE